MPPDTIAHCTDTIPTFTTENKMATASNSEMATATKSKMASDCKSKMASDCKSEMASDSKSKMASCNNFRMAADINFKMAAGDNSHMASDGNSKMAAGNNKFKMTLAGNSSSPLVNKSKMALDNKSQKAQDGKPKMWLPEVKPKVTSNATRCCWKTPLLLGILVLLFIGVQTAFGDEISVEEEEESDDGAVLELTDLNFKEGRMQLTHMCSAPLTISILTGKLAYKYITHAQ